MAEIKLNDGFMMPQPGFGVFRIPDAEVAPIVRSALEVGYRHIDTASVYENEAGVGQGLRESGIKREDVFVTTKLWNDMQGEGQPAQAIDASLKKLGLDYVDLYLVHWPLDGRQQATWEAMQAIRKAGKTKSIGVSNFRISDLEILRKMGGPMPAVNQVECYPYFAQNKLVDYCKANGVAVQAWGPLSMGKTDLLKDAVLVDIAGKYGKTTAQVVLRWFIERGITPLPKSASAERQKQNLELFDFALDADDMARIAKLDTNRRLGGNPDEIAGGKSVF